MLELIAEYAIDQPSQRSRIEKDATKFTLHLSCSCRTFVLHLTHRSTDCPDIVNIGDDKGLGIMPGCMRALGVG